MASFRDYPAYLKANVDHVRTIVNTREKTVYEYFNLFDKQLGEWNPKDNCFMINPELRKDMGYLCGQVVYDIIVENFANLPPMMEAFTKNYTVKEYEIEDEDGKTNLTTVIQMVNKCPIKTNYRCENSNNFILIWRLMDEEDTDYWWFVQKELSNESFIATETHPYNGSNTIMYPYCKNEYLKQARWTKANMITYTEYLVAIENNGKIEIEY